MTRSLLGANYGIFFSHVPAGLPDTSWLRPNTQCRDRQQRHQVQAPGGGVHFRALAGPDLQGEGPGQQRAAGPQAAQRGAQAEVHLQKGCVVVFVLVSTTRCFTPSPRSLTYKLYRHCACTIKSNKQLSVIEMK